MSKKLNKLVNRKTILSIGLVVIFVATFSVAVATGGFGLFDRQIYIENFNGNLVVNNPEPINGQDDTLGSIFGGAFVEQIDKAATSTTEASMTANTHLFDRFIRGDETRTLTTKVKVLNRQSATNTIFFMQNNEGNDIYVDRDDIAFLVTGAPASDTNLVVGTSTSQYMNLATFVFVDGVLTGGTSENAFLSTGVQKSNLATSSEILTFEYSGTNTQPRLRILPGSYLVGYATSTDVEGNGSATTTNSSFDGKLFVPYSFYE